MQQSPEFDVLELMDQRYRKCGGVRRHRDQGAAEGIPGRCIPYRHRRRSWQRDNRKETDRHGSSQLRIISNQKGKSVIEQALPPPGLPIR